MRFLPFETLTLISEAPIEAVAERLRAAVAPRRIYWFRPPQPFLGSIRKARFKVMETGLHSWRSVIEGELLRCQGGTKAQVHLRLSWPVTVFLGLFFAAIFAMTIAIAIYDARRSRGVGGALAMALLALPAGYSFVNILFQIAAKRASELLCRCLGGRFESRG